MLLTYLFNNIKMIYKQYFISGEAFKNIYEGISRHYVNHNVNVCDI